MVEVTGTFVEDTYMSRARVYHRRVYCVLQQWYDISGTAVHISFELDSIIPRANQLARYLPGIIRSWNWLFASRLPWPKDRSSEFFRGKKAVHGRFLSLRLS